MTFPDYIETGHLPDDVVTTAVEMFLVDGTEVPAGVIDPFWVRKAHEYIERCRSAGYLMPNESRALWELAIGSVVDEDGRFIEESA